MIINKLCERLDLIPLVWPSVRAHAAGGYLSLILPRQLLLQLSHLMLQTNKKLQHWDSFQVIPL